MVLRGTSGDSSLKKNYKLILLELTKDAINKAIKRPPQL
jgi:hypothetical protein